MSQGARQARLCGRTQGGLGPADGPRYGAREPERDCAPKLFRLLSPVASNAPATSLHTKADLTLEPWFTALTSLFPGHCPPRTPKTLPVVTGLLL